MGIKTDVLTQSMPVPIDDIRHVIALEDPETGEIKDHIIEHAYAGKPYFERPAWSRLPRFSRYVSGLDLEIPWPTEDEPEIKDGEYDTLRYEVDEISWTPSLENPPFPSSVLDELRNKYSRFRTRHDPEYVRQKVIEEYRREWLESQSLLTPLGQYRQQRAAKSAEAKAAKLDANGNVIMDEETNAFIRQFMSMNVSKSQPKSTKSKQKSPNAKQTA
jgi:large subunit ribosomal protein L24